MLVGTDVRLAFDRMIVYLLDIHGEFVPAGTPTPENSSLTVKNTYPYLHLVISIVGN